ncbi:MAG: GGDEF domain-containing protein [Proteobacteria bacterium]|nr:GGDEF domain-containing protein [Pseudomonadota bacterium]MBU1649372.1 GGDEF domain-containing protein [Pseudomonadota bacterium]
MQPEDILKTVLSSTELPTLPTVASALISLTSREDTTLTDIADLVSKDIALSAKILKVSNSAFYSFPQQIGSINQAVSILGINAVRSLVLSFSFLSIKGGKKSDHFDFQKFWERSLASAVAAKLILGKVKGADTEEIFISGLLQNLGELIFAKTFPDQYEEVLCQLKEEQGTTTEIEKRLIGVDHCFIGYEVAKSWGFPEVLLLPILFHHDPQQYAGQNLKIKATTNAVYLSDILINILSSRTPEEYHKQFQKEAKKLFGLSSADINSILSDLHHQLDQAAAYFGLNIKNSKSIQEILQEANIKLSLLNLNYDQINQQLVQTKIKLENLTMELQEKNKILDNLANIDGLTEVYNHRYFQTSLDQEINRSSRHQTAISLLLIDIDHFKDFNDTYGHQAGDFVLKKFCEILQNNLRKYDTLARYGGEEFVIILPETSEEDALLVAEKLRAAIEDATFVDLNHEYHVTASFGLSSAYPGKVDGFNKNNFINQSDLALYDAKKEGRNRVAVYGPKKKWFKF